MLLDIKSHVLRESEPLQIAFEVFEKKCSLYRAHSNEEASENLKVAVVHKNLQDTELRSTCWGPLQPWTASPVSRRGRQIQLRGRCGAGKLRLWTLIGKIRGTVPEVAQAIHRFQGARQEPSKMKFKEAMTILKSELKFGRVFLQRRNRMVTPRSQCGC